MDVDVNTLAQLLTIILGILATKFAYAYVKIKNGIPLGKQKIEEIDKLLDDIESAIQDNVITAEELEKIINDIRTILHR